MMREDEFEALCELARVRGVLTSYHDVAGTLREASPEALLEVLRVLGEPVRDMGGVPAALSRWREKLRDSWPEPVVVAWDGGEEKLPLGYHRREVRCGGTDFEQLVISAPSRAFGAGRGARTWAAFLPLYALRAGNDWGAGDYTSLGELARFAGELGGGRVATLPLNAAFLDDPFDPSPYAPASRLFWNELYLDLTRIPELARCARARKRLESDALRRELRALRDLDHMDARRLMAAKRPVLEALSETFFDGESARRDEFEAYCQRRLELGPYAAFRAGDRGEADRLYHAYAQWLCEEQISNAAETARAAGGGLLLDMPLGVMEGSFDVWRHRGLFAIGMGAGAPPDELGPAGQDWGFPPLRPDAIREDGYRYLVECLRTVMRPASALRIDHVMGLHRLFWVPRGMTPKDGVYVRYHAEELWAVLLLESHLNECEIVGENLGTVPDEVNRAMTRHAVRGMYVVPFEIRARPAPRVMPVAEGQQVSLNTHDLPPFAAWWGALDPAPRSILLDHLRRGGWLDPDVEDAPAVLRACLSWLAASDAAEFVVNLEDLWGEERPQNVPGTGAEMRNFLRRATRSLREIREDDQVAGFLGEIAGLRAEGGEMGKGRKNGAVRDIGFLSADDLHLLGEGSHLHSGKKLGSHLVTAGGEPGTHFAVWAPNAERVSVIGDFNGWDRESHPLLPQQSSGIWAGFVPGVAKGAIYKYFIASRERGYRVEKTDPYAVHFEEPPRSASVVWDLDYEWGDADWMETRAGRNSLDAPISVYEVHLGSWRRSPDDPKRFLSYRELAPLLAEYATDMGFTHVELLPVMEHPFYGSWGYQVLGNFAPTARYGTPQDFMHLVDHLHRAGIGVILDWVPSHFPKDEHGLAYFDGTHLYEHADPRKGHHPDWDSLIYNYGRHEVRGFLMSVAIHWLERFHIDGLRTDAVASMLYLDYSRKEGEWIPNEYGGRENLQALAFLRRLNEEIYAAFPDVQMIAEESTSFPMISRPTSVGGVGFGMKWDMGWMHDTLEYMKRDPIHRKHHQNDLTFRQIYAFAENFMLSLSHDEVVHGKRSLLEKMAGDDWQKFANLRLLFAYQFAQAGKKLIFMGGEIAQRSEWYHETSLDWHLLEYAPHSGVQSLVRDLNRLYREEPALHARDCVPAGFDWVDCHDAESSVLTFLRRGGEPERTILAACHFTPVPRDGYRVGVPRAGAWRVILNSDAEEYGGSGAGTEGAVEAEPTEWNGRPFSIVLDLPPLGALYLKPE